MTILLPSRPITHAHWKPFLHPRLGVVVNGRTVVKYMRFLRPVRIERLELRRFNYARWAPMASTHPAHLIISTLNPSTFEWETVKEADLDADSRISGEGLNQDMSETEMNAHFQRAIDEQVTPTVHLEGLETDFLRVECDREHPVFPVHGENNGGEYNVPFGILNTLSVYGEPLTGETRTPAYSPILVRGEIRPEAPQGMTFRQWGETLIYESPFLSVGFALRRPILMHLGWDVLGKGMASANRLATRHVRADEYNRGMSGPHLVTPWGDYGSHTWTGQVEITGNRIAYRNLHPSTGVTVNATFQVEPDRLTLELTQEAEKPLAALETEAWRLAFNVLMGHGMTGAAGIPSELPGRSGDCVLPAMIAGDGPGCLAVNLLEGERERVRMQVESYRLTSEITAGILLGGRNDPAMCTTVPAGKERAVIEWKVDNLEPVRREGAPEAGLGVRRHWASNFACYRPELGGFSNNAVGTNCHVNQYAQIEVTAFTTKPSNGFDPLEPARFTITRALMDGPAYTYWRHLYLDADPVLVSSAGRIFGARRDLAWLRRVEPGLVEATQRMLGTIGEEGLAISFLSGNSGSFRWSSNMWDIVSFGHQDAYSNAWTYRALRNSEVLLKVLGRKDLAMRSREAADCLKEIYARAFINPETGWVLSWRSRDGQVHDYAFLSVNGPACAFGVLEPEVARTALQNLEALRNRLGLQSARLGLPYNLLPLRKDDYIFTLWHKIYAETGFEFYADGSASPGALPYYLRALSIHGFKDAARQIAADVDAGFADGLFTGGAGGGEGSIFGNGNEFHSWEGLAGGYEGTFGPVMGALYSVAIEQGLFEPPEPEWWPEE
jgi:hypothetical protein